MKSKQKNLLFLIVLYLASLACNGNPNQQVSTPSITIEQNFATRESDIESDNPHYKTPENWNTTPATCSKSLLKLWLFEEGLVNISSGSASLVTSSLYKDRSGNDIWVYHVLTADHIVKDNNGKIIGSKIIAFPLDYQGQDLVYGYLNYTQLYDQFNTPLDAGVYSFFSLGTNSLSNYLIPAGSQSLTNGSYLIPGSTDFYFGFGYPNNIGNPQYTIATVNKAEANSIYLKPIEQFSNVTKGNSGGPICNLQSTQSDCRRDIHDRPFRSRSIQNNTSPDQYCRAVFCGS